MAKKAGRETITSERAAELLGVSIMSISRWCNEGLLESYQLSPAPNSARRIYVDSVVAYARKVQGRDIVV